MSPRHNPLTSSMMVGVELRWGYLLCGLGHIDSALAPGSDCLDLSLSFSPIDQMMPRLQCQYRQQAATCSHVFALDLDCICLRRCHCRPSHFVSAPFSLVLVVAYYSLFPKQASSLIQQPQRDWLNHLQRLQCRGQQAPNTSRNDFQNYHYVTDTTRLVTSCSELRPSLSPPC